MHFMLKLQTLYICICTYVYETRRDLFGPKASTISRVRLLNSTSGAKNIDESKLPCTVILGPTAFRAAVGLMV